MKKSIVLIIVAAIIISVIGTGCQTGQMATILGGSGLVGGAAIATGYKYVKNGTVTSNDINDIATSANTGYALGDIAGTATDHAVIMHKVKKK